MKSNQYQEILDLSSLACNEYFANNPTNPMVMMFMFGYFVGFFFNDETKRGE